MTLEQIPSGLPRQCRQTRSFKMADLYCGGGGTSTAILEVADFLRVQCLLTVWNHWSIAIQTHKTNHPLVEHYCEDLNNVNPRKHFQEAELDCLWASPSCFVAGTMVLTATGLKPIESVSVGETRLYRPRQVEKGYTNL